MIALFILVPVEVIEKPPVEFKEIIHQHFKESCQETLSFLRFCSTYSPKKASPYSLLHVAALLHLIDSLK